MIGFAGVHRKERSPEGAHPAELLQFEEDRDRVLTDIVRAQVAFENHPDLPPGGDYLARARPAAGGA